MKHRNTRRLSGLMAALLLLSASPARAAYHPRIQRDNAQLASSIKEEDTAESPESVSEEPEEPREKERPEDELSGPEILAQSQLIAHGLGAVDGINTLNCLEGFLAQYEAGIRVFEVDIRLTRDAKAVLRHDWRYGWQQGIGETSIPTLEQFRSEKLLDKYTPLSFRDLLLLMEEYSDICVITDTKFTEPEVFMIEFDAMVADAKELGLSYLFDRMIFQVYNKNMFTALHNAYHFPHYIYTFYNEGFPQTEAAFRDRAIFCSQYGIGGITMWDYWWKPAYVDIAEEYGVHIYAHTVNEAERTKELLAGGLDAVYTDSLIPDDLIEPEPAEEQPYKN